VQSVHKHSTEHIARCSCAIDENMWRREIDQLFDKIVRDLTRVALSMHASITPDAKSASGKMAPKCFRKSGHRFSGQKHEKIKA
jgi:hypothetical protein